jgi:hypothetical protein
MQGRQEPNTLRITAGDLSDRIWPPLEQTAADDLLSGVLLTILLLQRNNNTFPNILSKYLINSEVRPQIVSIT